MQKPPFRFELIKKHNKIGLIYILLTNQIDTYIKVEVFIYK